MPWIRHALPSDAVPWGVWYDRGRWVFASFSDENYASVDLATYSVMPDVLPRPGGGVAAVGDIANDGLRWYAGSRANAWYRSTDGMVGLAWEAPSPQIISSAAGAGVGVNAVCVTSTGRIIALAGRNICASDDGGATWADKGATDNIDPGSTTPLDTRIKQAVDGTIVLTCEDSRIYISSDNGESWSWLYPGLSAQIATVAKISAGYCVTYKDADVAPRVSADNGATWTTVALLGQPRCAAEGESLCLYGGEYELPEVRITTDLVAWSTLDMTGLGAEWFVDVAMGGGLFVGVQRWDTYGVYSIGVQETGPQYVVTPWPVAIVAPRAFTGWPVDVVLPPERRAVTAWRVAIVAPQQAVTAWPVQVLDPSRLGGLDGAASWAAAPDGRWQAVVWLGTDNISARILGTVSVQIEADAARTAEFSFLPAAPIQPLGLIGQRVRLAFAQAGGVNAQTIFRGVVETPTIDLQTGVITCACHDQAQEVWANTPRETIAALVGGRWHVAVSGEPEDNFEYMRERLQSVGASWALDANQAPRILPWAAPSRTVTVRQSDVLDGSLAIDLPSREQLRTRIDVRMQYRYPVHRGRGISAQWAQPLNFFLPRITETMTKQAYIMPDVGMVESAADNPPGWERVTLSIEHPPAGTWNVGTELQPAIYNISQLVAPSLAIGFSGTYRTRWQQTVTEDYTLAVVWDALEAQIGQPVGEEIGATLESQFDAPDWGNDPSVEPQINVFGVGDVSQPYYAPGAAPADRDEVLRTLLDRAWVRLWSASRTGRVRFALPCRPDLWLDTGCLLEGGRVRASGVIVALDHVLDVDAGRATTDIAVAVGMPGATPAALPVWSLPASPYVPALPSLDQLSATIGTYVGGLASSPPFEAETMIGLVTNEDGAEVPGRNYYPVGLTIGWPALTADDRDPRDIDATAVVSVAVPTDTLEIL